MLELLTILLIISYLICVYLLTGCLFMSVTMQAQKEMPPDMQCKDKFLLLSVITIAGATPKDITPEMVTIQLRGFYAFEF